MVLVVRRGGLLALVARGGGVPGRPTDYFFFLAGGLADCRLGEGRGAGCLTRAGGDRWPKTTVRVQAGLGGQVWPSGRCTAAVSVF